MKSAFFDAVVIALSVRSFGEPRGIQDLDVLCVSVVKRAIPTVRTSGGV